MAKVARKTLDRARKLRRRLTNAETILWSRLRRNALGVRFRRQHPIGPYIADFACVDAHLVVEVDGGTHGSDAELSHDTRRDTYMRALGWRIMRIWNAEVYESLDEIVWRIGEVIRAEKSPDSRCG